MMPDWTKVLAIATAVAAGANAGVAGILLWQVSLLDTQVHLLRNQTDTLGIQTSAMQEQVVANKQSLNISYQTFTNVLRPWVGVKEVHFDKISCIRNDFSVKTITRDEIDNFDPRLGYKSINQFVSKNSCVAIDFVFDVVVKNAGAIPAKSVKLAYTVADNRESTWNNTDFSRFEATTPLIPQYKTLTLMPQQEATVQLKQGIKLQDFPFLDTIQLEEDGNTNDTDSQSGFFESIPNLFLVGLEYYYGDKSDSGGVVYETTETSELVIVNSWSPRFG